MKHWLLAVLFLTSFKAYSQGEIRGAVSDSVTGDSLKFCNIILEQDGQFITGTISDSSGKYLLSSIKAGVYKIKADYHEYYLTSQTITVNDSQTTFLELNLKEKDDKDKVIPPPICGGWEPPAKVKEAKVIPLDTTKVFNISGYVTDRITGDSLDDVTMLLYRTSDSIAYTIAKSDSNGYYKIYNIPFGSWELHFYYVGYRNLVYEKINIDSACSIEINADISEDDEEIIVCFTSTSKSKQFWRKIKSLFRKKSKHRVY